MKKITNKIISGKTNCLASFIEHTLLGDQITKKSLVAHLEQAKQMAVFAVCVPIEWIAFSRNFLKDSPIKIVSVVDFPLGSSAPGLKAEEAREAKEQGADELDMVMDYHAIISRDYQKALAGISAVVMAVAPLPIKVIVETSALSQAQLVCAITIVALSGAQFIKTSTGFHDSGAKEADILLMRQLLPPSIKIKASGGISSKEQALKLISAGANRIGCSKEKLILNN